MAEFAGEFDDRTRDERAQQPLPADDRLWRHPSELGNANPALSLDPLAVRRRWLQSEQTRASAWTAGIVGAVLATGLVALGTHLATALTGASGTPSNPTLAAQVAAGPTSPNGSAPSASVGITAALMAKVHNVGAAIAVLDISRGAAEFRCLGLVVRSDGMLLAPAAQLQSATVVTVSVGGVDGYVATVLGSDAQSGLAVLQINPVRPLSTVKISSARPSTGAMVLAVTAARGASTMVGTVQSSDVAPMVNGVRLVDALSTNLPSDLSPAGAPVLNGMGNVVGIVTGHDALGEIVTPQWIAQPIADQLIATGSVSHGWLGIVVAPHTPSKKRPGVAIVSVDPNSAAAEAKLKTGDVLVSVDGRSVTSMAALRGDLYALRPGDTASLVIRRNGVQQRTTVTLDDGAIH